MRVLREAPEAIDRAIERIQEAFELQLQWENYTSYGRIYKNKKDKHQIAEWYAGENRYKEVFWDDRQSAVSFFSIADKKDIENGGVRVVASAIFFVNLAKISPANDRDDEKVRTAVLRCFTKPQLISVETGLDNVLREFKRDHLKAVDMHPMHCFRINFFLTYNPYKHC